MVWRLLSIVGVADGDLRSLAERLARVPVGGRYTPADASVDLAPGSAHPCLKPCQPRRTGVCLIGAPRLPSEMLADGRSRLAGSLDPRTRQWSGNADAVWFKGQVVWGYWARLPGLVGRPRYLPSTHVTSRSRNLIDPGRGHPPLRFRAPVIEHPIGRRFHPPCYNRPAMRLARPGKRRGRTAIG